ncbi:hypothetical protein K4F52_001427 [Lecanicillium sp. MT-2017a]|nr:hypothetical protein K4F52_001427 [Lecanicillium sp. MT-2017a]
MSEYWKSTPRYWCKYCAVYVRDTKIERANHEATGRHQGAIKRSLRDLHRSHDREERDKDRARREIDRLNGIKPGSSSSSSAAAAAAGGSAGPSQAEPAVATEASLKKQREQLAEMGIEVPSSFRPDMAIPGEWTVTNTRVIETNPEAGDKVESRASGVRKREETEEHKEEEEAVRGLFKKPRRWGRDSKAMPAEDDAELDALLNGSLVTVKKPSAEEEEEGGRVKTEGGDGAKTTTVKQELDTEDGEGNVKTEEDGGARVKEEPLDGLGAGLEDVKPKNEEGEAAAGAVVFKKRKPKGLRTK